MKNILKKNQLMITALAIMIAVAGYLQFTGSNLDEEDYLPASGDAQVLDQTGVEDFAAGSAFEDYSNYSLDGLLDLSEEDLAASGELTEIPSLDSDVELVENDYLEEGMDTTLSGWDLETPDNGEIPGEAVFTNTNGVTVLWEAKLLKEQIRAKNKEDLLSIINNTTLSDAQKQSAVDAMVQMTTIAQQELDAEILLEAKGFPDVIVSIGNGSVDVVVNAAELSEAQRAQIEDIVKRKTNVDAANIVISTVVQ